LILSELPKNSARRRILRKFAAPKDFPEFSLEAMAESFHLAKHPKHRLTFPKSFYLYSREWKISKISIFSKRLRKFGAPKDFPEFSLEAMAESFHLAKHPKPRLTFPKSFHPFLPSEKSPIFSFYEAPKKFGASKNFGLHPQNFCDKLKFSWSRSPIRMTFYSTQKS